MLSHIVTQWKIEAALRALRKLRIPFKGPLTTVKKHHIYLIGGYILRETELLALHRDGKLRVENSPRLLLDVKRLLGREESRGSANERS